MSLSLTEIGRRAAAAASPRGYARTMGPPRYDNSQGVHTNQGVPPVPTITKG